MQGAGNCSLHLLYEKGDYVMLRSQSYIATPPGATIKEQLDDKGIGQKEFAVKMDMSEELAEELIQGNMLLTPEIAANLEAVLGVPTEFWNKMEEIYRRKIAKIKAENAKLKV